MGSLTLMSERPTSRGKIGGLRMKTHGRLFQEAEIELYNDEWDKFDRERVLIDAETLLLDKIGEVTDAIDIDGKINPTDNSIIFMVMYHNNGIREFYPGGHNFDGQYESISEIEVADPEEEIREQAMSLENLIGCDIFFHTVNKEWREY